MQDELSQQLFGDNAVLVTAPIADHRNSLYPSELKIISGAIEKRAFEFSTGRYCAHKALQALGIDDFPVIRGGQREPIWPEHIVGSISHCRDIAGTAVANSRKVKSIGLDIENQKQINPDISRHVCTDKEQQWLETLNAAQRVLTLLRIFSIKEAIFKCVYQVNREQLRFKQCQIIPDSRNNFIEVEIQLDGISLQRGELAVQSNMIQDHIYSSAIWHYLPAVG